MARYYFHLRTEYGYATDPEGAEFASLALAIEEAKASAREVAAGSADKGQPIDGECFEIADATQTIVAVVHWAEAIQTENTGLNLISVTKH